MKHGKRDNEYSWSNIHDRRSAGRRYCLDCHVGKVVPDDTTITAVSEGVRTYAVAPENAEALWKKSEELVGETF